ncbi:MAG TPA: single-stranded DNA-binding protein [Actinomycetota bacterium]|nr:single-stranded DNA-binding protein [Actinomycetota bacterium]
MVTVNVVVLAGRLSADPEFTELPSGDTVARLRLQVPEAGKRLLPLPVAAWDRPVRRGCERLARGDSVMIRGHLVRRFFKGAGGGRSVMEVVASEVKKLEDDDIE